MTTAWTPNEIDRLTTRFGTSDLNGVSVDDVERQVDNLCSQYSTEDPTQLRDTAQAQLAAIDQLLDRRLTLSDQGVLVEQAGWLALLLAALNYDIGDAETAEHARQLALAIGQDMDCPSILGWAHETAAWIEIANSNWPGAIERADRGLKIAEAGERTGVAIQLALQLAEALARTGDTDGMNDALARARRSLSTHEPPSNPKHHFRFDHDKFDLRQMRILLIVGNNDEAEQIAARLYDELQNPDGSSKHPMRTSEVLASRGLIEARRGNIDQAVDYANQAIDIGRRSRISFRQITAALADELAMHLEQPSARRFLDRRADVLQGRR